MYKIELKCIVYASDLYFDTKNYKNFYCICMDCGHLCIHTVLSDHERYIQLTIQKWYTEI